MWRGSPIREWEAVRKGMGLPTMNDRIYREEGAGLSVAFLRTLAHYESEQRWDPRSKAQRKVDAMDDRELAVENALRKIKGDKPAKRTKYWGLFQVGAGVLSDYNKVHTKKVSKAGLRDPGLNTRVAAWQLARIARAYGRGPHSKLKTDWLKEDWVRMLVAGWNTGWSKRSGLQLVADWLKKKGATVTHQQVMKSWNKAGARPFEPGRLTKKWKWHRQVAQRFVKERRRAVSEEDLDKGPLAKTQGLGRGALLLIALWWWSTQRKDRR